MIVELVVWLQGRLAPICLEFGDGLESEGEESSGLEAVVQLLAYEIIGRKLLLLFSLWKLWGLVVEALFHPRLLVRFEGVYITHLGLRLSQLHYGFIYILLSGIS